MIRSPLYNRGGTRAAGRGASLSVAAGKPARPVPKYRHGQQRANPRRNREDAAPNYPGRTPPVSRLPGKQKDTEGATPPAARCPLDRSPRKARPIVSASAGAANR